ncbi:MULTISPECIES: hypothetical protein [Natrialbaceae]|uniref:hypothetical protein n=1 Tax=Natrialbaceae TaxID=1644061 RepID=UPI00207C731C|nr:hypothetical protein [Natronococcus sp. CG52]
MYSASRGIHYTAPPSPSDETEERTNEAESESTSAPDRSVEERSAAASATEARLAADD